MIGSLSKLGGDFGKRTLGMVGNLTERVKESITVAIGDLRRLRQAAVTETIDQNRVGTAVSDNPEGEKRKLKVLCVHGAPNLKLEYQDQYNPNVILNSIDKLLEDFEVEAKHFLWAKDLKDPLLGLKAKSLLALFTFYTSFVLGKPGFNPEEDFPDTKVYKDGAGYDPVLKLFNKIFSQVSKSQEKLVKCREFRAKIIESFRKEILEIANSDQQFIVITAHSMGAGIVLEALKTLSPEQLKNKKILLLFDSPAIHRLFAGLAPAGIITEAERDQIFKKYGDKLAMMSRRNCWDLLSNNIEEINKMEGMGELKESLRHVNEPASLLKFAPLINWFHLHIGISMEALESTFTEEFVKKVFEWVKAENDDEEGDVGASAGESDARVAADSA